MPVLKAELSVSSIENLINDINDYKTKIENLPKQLEYKLAEIAVDEIKANLLGITDTDGNAIGIVGVETQINKTIVYNQGEDVAYIEYGTGVNGKINSHPDAEKAGWQYDMGSTIHTTKGGKRMWKYYDNIKGHYRITSGIPAQMQLLKASIKIRNRIKKIAGELVK